MRRGPERTALARTCRAAILLLGAAAAPAAATPGFGANTFDLLLQFTGRASAGDGSAAYRRVTQAMGRKSILDARDAGFGFLRLAAAGYGPNWPNDQMHNDLALWLSDPAAYWTDVDAMFDALDAASMRIVPSFIWNAAQFPALTGETLGDLIRNPRSKSRAMAQRYIEAFIGRYARRRTILFYELGNELNLTADLDLVARCRRQRPGAARLCAATSNYSTEDLIAFSRDMVAAVRRADPSRAVSSGFAAPREDAAHLARRPEYAVDGPDWTTDSAAEATAYLLRTNVPFGIVSLHIYPGTRPSPGSTGLPRGAALARFAGALFHPLGKQLFVGEFGDRGGSHLFADLAPLVREGDVNYAAVWAWEFYQFSVRQPPDAAGGDYRIEPGHADEAVRAELTPPPGPRRPRVVLTWPLPCARVDRPADLFAVASLGAATPAGVTFFVNGQFFGAAASPPYRVRFNPVPLGPRLAVIEARATGADGAVARFSSTVLANGYGGPCTITP